MNKREILARSIGIGGVLAAIVAIWQFVRFCQGEMWSPLVLAGNYFAVQFGGGEWLVPNTGNATGLMWMERAYCVVLFYLFGLAGWMLVAVLVLVTSQTAKRIVEVGYAQYRLERAAAQEESARLAKINASRERRREARRRRDAAKGSGVGAFVLGLVVGTIFFK